MEITRKLNIILTNIPTAVIIPIKYNEKRPKVEWKNINKTDVTLFNKFSNFGIITGKKSEITIIDIDVKDNGLVEYEKLIKEKGDIETLKARSPSGGLHLYFNYNELIKTTTKVNGIGIDIRNDNAIIVCEPSVINNNKYKFDTSYKISDIPTWLFEWILLDGNMRKQSNKINEQEQVIKINERIQPNIIHNSSIVEYKISDEILQHILDKLPINYLNNYSDWIKIGTICKTLNKYTIFDNWSKKSKQYNKIENEYLFKYLRDDIMDVNWLINIHNKNNPTDKLEYIKPIIKLELLHNNTLNKIEINVEKLDKNIYDNKYSTIIPDSDTATAKTTSCAIYFEELKKIYPDIIILSIVSRISLADQQIQTFAKYNVKLKSYEGKYEPEDNLVTTLESLTKYNYYENYSDHVVFLDEVSSLLKHIGESDTIKNRVELIALFTKIITEAKIVIACDATINDCVIEHLSSLRGTNNILFIDNKYKNYKDINAIECRTEEELSEKMIKDINEHKKFIFGFDSLTKLKQFHQILENLPNVDKTKILLISSEHGNKKVDTNEWSNYDYILFSPKIIYGCDFVPLEKYDVFILVNDYTLNCEEVSQQICRNRNIGEVIYFVKQKNYKLKWKTFEEALEYYKEYHHLYTEIFNQLGALNMQYDGSVKFMENIYTRSYIRYKYYENVYDSDFLHYFKEILKKKGFNIRDVEETKQKIEITKFEVNEYNNKQLKNYVEGKLDEKSVYKMNIDQKIEILNINKTVVTKYQEILTNNVKLRNHFNICKMLTTEKEIKQKIKTSTKGTLKNMESVEAKIIIVEQFEKIIGLTRFDIDHEKHKKHFEDKINIDTKLYELYKTMFRQKEKQPETWKDVYHIIIKCYKHICGSEIIVTKRSKNNHFERMYSINNNYLITHKQLCKLRNKNDNLFD